MIAYSGSPLKCSFVDQLCDMLIDWFLFLGSLVILWVPASLLYPAGARQRLSDYRSSRFRIERMLVTWQHWIDLVRGFGGAFLLTRVAVVPDPAVDEGLLLHLAVTGVVLTLAVAAQTLQRSETFYATAPVFYIWGVAFALVDWVPVLFSLVFSAILSRMVNHVEMNFPVMAGLLGVVGFLYGGFSFELALACVLIILPLVLAYATMQSMVCYSRELAIE